MNKEAENAINTISEWNKILEEFVPNDPAFREVFKRKLDMMEEDLIIAHGRCVALIEQIEASCQSTVSTCSDPLLDKTMKIGKLQFFRGMCKKAQDILDLIDKAEGKLSELDS